MTAITHSTIDAAILAEESRFLSRTPRSRALHEQAVDVMPGGVTSSWSSTRPVPVWIDRGEGAHVWDADGNRYVDYPAGYGVNVVGHANPSVVENTAELARVIAATDGSASEIFSVGGLTS